jgi:PKD repeat protein
LRSFSLKRTTIPKVAVLVAGLAVAMVAATVHPAPAQAYPTYGTGCTGCHTAGGSVTATPSAASVAPGAAYTVALAFTGGTGKVGYAITGNGANVNAIDAGPASMTAPAAVGSYTYTVWMRTGVVASTTYSITVAPPVVVTAPVASFTTSVASGTFPLPVTMTDTSTNTPTSWAWSMGDGTTSTVRNPSVTYATAGTKTVTLVATNAGGSSTMVSKTISVTAPVVIPPAPVASFTTSVASGTFPLPVTMTDTSTNTPTSWAWDFGNGTTSTVQNPLVTYTVAGTYSVTLTATNSAGTNTSAAQTITVQTPAPVVTAPVASFTTSVASGTFPLPVTMTDTSTNTPTSWAWSMGDGTTSTVQNPSVTYLTAGTKTVTLVATNAGGASTLVSKTITVTDPVVVPPAPVASFTASAISGIAPLAVTFADTSTGVPTSWLWTFGNGSSSNLQNPAAVTYTTAGTYTVKLIASNANGASAPVTKTITVTATVPTPSAAHISSLSPHEAYVGTKVTITGTGFGTAGVVRFGTVVATASSWTDTTIVVLVPAGVTREEVDVTVTPAGGSASNGVEFEVKSNHDGYEHHSVHLDESFN